MKPEAIFFSGHSHSGPAIGGAHRTRQLLECLAPVATVRPAKSDGFHRKARLKNYWHGLPTALRQYPYWLASPAGIGRAGVAWRLVVSALEQYPQAKLCVWENTGQQAIGKFVRQQGRRLAAFPQNLESLALPGGLTDVLRPNTVENEALSLKQADLIVTISQEEQWVLANFGVTAHHLPYYPPEDLQGRLERVRDRRGGQDQSDVLILGSAVYPPSAASLRFLLASVAVFPESLRESFVLAGNGTENLAAEAKAAGVRCAGTLADEELDQLLASSVAVLLWQTQGAGALTRIPEMLLAGVPIIANPIALRSARHHAGVLACDSTEEIPDLLSRVPAIAPRPAPPAKETARVQALIRELAAQ